MTDALDALTSFVSRSLRLEIDDVRSELVAKDAQIELERISYRAGDTTGTLLLERLPPEAALEVLLLPHLARKSDRVPSVFSRGLPPPGVPAWPWVLVEDLLGAPSACEVEPRGIVLAKVAIEQAVARDAPALRALRVPVVPPAELAERIVARLDAEAAARWSDDLREAGKRLADWPQAIVHGSLVCANTALTDRGVVITEWRYAHLGCALLDVVRLSRDVSERGEGVLGVALPRIYADAIGLTVGSEELRAAELIERLEWRYLRNRALEWRDRAGRTVAAKAEEVPGSTGQGSG